MTRNYDVGPMLLRFVVTKMGAGRWSCLLEIGLMDVLKRM